MHFETDSLNRLQKLKADCHLTTLSVTRGQLRPPRPDQMCPGGANWGMFNDLGVYGVPRAVREKKR